MDRRPLKCRFRLSDENKRFPKSSCEACGKSVMTGLGKQCSEGMPETQISMAEAMNRKTQILTGYVAIGLKGEVQGYTFAKLPDGDKWFKIGSHSSSSLVWCQTEDTNGESNHSEYDDIFGEGNWVKEWIGELPEGPNWICTYCQYSDDDLNRDSL